MLVLTRKHLEKIIIDGGIEIQILEVKGKQVRVGINAPPHIKIHREEVLNRINKEKGDFNGNGDDHFLEQILWQNDQGDPGSMRNDYFNSEGSYDELD
jgi:carbon storage regulator